MMPVGGGGGDTAAIVTSSISGDGGRTIDDRMDGIVTAVGMANCVDGGMDDG